MVRAQSVAANVLVLVFAGLLFADSFLDWLGARASVGPVEITDTANAWQLTVCALAIVVGVLVLVPAILRLSGLDVPGGVIIAMGGFAFGLVLLKLVLGPEIDTGGFDVEIDKTREIGIYLGLVLTAGITGAGLFQLVDDKRA